MLLEDLDKSELVIFLQNNLIPLGMNSYKGVSKDKIISMPYGKFSGAWGVIGKSGSGKTVLLKRIMSYVLGFYRHKYEAMGFSIRPAVIFDMQSEDHHLIKFPNSKPENLFYDQGERPFGFDNILNFAPVFVMEESHSFDRPFGFSVDVFTIKDFISIGMGAGAAKKLKNLIKNNPESTDDIDAFAEALDELPTNKTELSRLPDGYMFKVETFLNYSSKQSMIQNFTIAYDDNVFTDRKGEYYKQSFTNDMKKDIIVINFHQAELYYPLYAGKIMRDIYMARRQSKRNFNNEFPPPVIIIEEAEKLVPIASDNNAGSVYWLGEILKRGRKYDFFSIIATQEANKLHEVVVSNTRQWIIGKINDEDISYFKFLPRNVMDVILRLNPDKHEFCIVYENGNYDSFYAWDSPLEINRESAFGSTRAR